MRHSNDDPMPEWARSAPAQPVRRAPDPALDRIAPAASDAVREVLARVQAAVRMRHYSRRTEKSYVAWIRRYITYHRGKDPSSLGASEVKAFLAQLAIAGRVSASTQNQAFS